MTAFHRSDGLRPSALCFFSLLVSSLILVILPAMPEATPPAAGDSEKGAEAATTRPEQIYDPSKESRWTRLGLSLESFKPAPGSTG